MQRKNSRFLEAEIIRAFKDVRDIVEFVFVLNHVVRTTVDLGLGRAARVTRSHVSFIFGAPGFRLFLTIPYTGNFCVGWESFCTSINPPSVQDVATGGKASVSERSTRGFEGNALHQKLLVFLFFPLLGFWPSLFFLLALVFLLFPFLTITVAFTTWCIFVDADSTLIDRNEFVKVFSDLPTQELLIIFLFVLQLVFSLFSRYE